MYGWSVEQVDNTEISYLIHVLAVKVKQRTLKENEKAEKLKLAL